MFQSAGNPTHLLFTGGRIREASADSQEAARGVIEDLAKAQPRELGVVERVEAYGLGTTVSIIVARFSIGGWCLVVTHTGRLPRWDEIAIIRNRLIPDDVNMAIPFPKIDRYIPFHRNSVLLWEVEPKVYTSRIHRVST